MVCEGRKVCDGEGQEHCGSRDPCTSQASVIAFCRRPSLPTRLPLLYPQPRISSPPAALFFCFYLLYFESNRSLCISSSTCNLPMERICQGGDVPILFTIVFLVLGTEEMLMHVCRVVNE